MPEVRNEAAIGVFKIDVGTFGRSYHGVRAVTFPPPALTDRRGGLNAAGRAHRRQGLSVAGAPPSSGFRLEDEVDRRLCRDPHLAEAGAAADLCQPRLPRLRPEHVCAPLGDRVAQQSVEPP
jgi:hypothetical protein